MGVQHTPGPWSVSKRSSRKVTNACGIVICNAVLRNMGGPKHKTSLKSEHEAEQNACLIAAAPELLEALEDCRRAIDLTGSGVADWQSMHEAASAKASCAIAKARGDA